MNKNFKKVMDLISEMKQSFSNQLIKFEQAALIDGTIVEFEVLEIGQAVFVVTETETIPAPEGTHELSGELEGVSIVVDANGIILEIIQFESFKSQPTNSISESEKFAKVGNLTAKQNWLKNNKNI
jgi:hypothetical protein